MERAANGDAAGGQPDKGRQPGREHSRRTAASRDAGHRTLTGHTPAAPNAAIRADRAPEGTL